MSLALEFHAVTPVRLGDLERFSCAHGKFRYCSCMRWRMTGSVFRASSKEQRAAALVARVARGEPVGVLADADGEPIGWCSVATREGYAGLERSTVLPRLDAAPVWSVACFFVHSGHRRQGVALGLLRAAVAYARTQGAAIIEGYPAEPDARSYTFMGTPALFLAAGFGDVTPPGQARRVMRHERDRSGGGSKRRPG